MIDTLISNRTDIGVDIGSSRIKVAQLTRGRAGWTLAAHAVYARESDTFGADEADRLREIIWRCGCEGDSIVIGVPRELERTAVLDLPPRGSGAPLEEICASELGRMYRLDPGEFELYAWEMPSTSTRSKTTQMCSTAVPHGGATEFVRVLESAGLRVRALDLSSCAAARALASAYAGTEGLAAVLDLGANGADLSVLHDGGMVYHRRLEGFGTGHFMTSLQRKLGLHPHMGRVLLERVGLDADALGQLPDGLQTRYGAVMRQQAESLLREILAASSYALERFPGETITEMRLAGGGAAIRQLAGYLAETSGLEVRLIACGDLVSLPRRFQESAGDCSLVNAIGHARWGSNS